MAEGFIGSLDSVFHFNVVARRCCSSGGRFRRSKPGPGDCCCSQEAESPMGWRRLVLGAPGERAQTLGGCRRISWSAYPAAGIPRRLLVVQSEEGEAVCCVLHCKSPLRPSPNGRRLRCRTDGGPALVLVGVDGPSSGLFPERAACVTAFPLYPRPAR